MYISHFAYQSIDGHLRCFHILAVVKNNKELECTNISETLLAVLLGTYPEVELLDHMVILFLISWGATILSSIAAVPFYSPTSSTQLVLVSPNTCQHLFSVLFIVAILIGVRIFIFLMIIVMLSVFSYTYWSFMYLLWRIVYSSPLPIFKIFFNCCWVIGVPYISWVLNSSWGIWFANISHVSQVAFSLCCVFSYTDFFDHPVAYGVWWSDLSCSSCSLSHSCSKAGSLTHCARLGIEPASQCSKDTADPIVLQWELPEVFNFDVPFVYFCFWFFFLPGQVCCWIPVVNFSFQLYSSAQNIFLVLLQFLSLSWYSPFIHASFSWFHFFMFSYKSYFKFSGNLFL